MITKNCYFQKSDNKYVKTYERPQGEFIEKIEITADEGKMLMCNTTMLKKVCCTPADAEKWQEVDIPEEAEEE